MPKMKADLPKIAMLSARLGKQLNSLNTVQSQIRLTYAGLDWQVACKQNVDARLNRLIRNLGIQVIKLENYCNFTQTAAEVYADKDHSLTRQCRDLTFELWKIGAQANMPTTAPVSEYQLLRKKIWRDRVAKFFGKGKKIIGDSEIWGFVSKYGKVYGFIGGARFIKGLVGGKYSVKNPFGATLFFAKDALAYAKDMLNWSNKFVKVATPLATTVAKWAVGVSAAATFYESYTINESTKGDVIGSAVKTGTDVGKKLFVKAGVGYLVGTAAVAVGVSPVGLPALACVAAGTYIGEKLVDTAVEYIAPNFVENTTELVKMGLKGLVNTVCTLRSPPVARWSLL